MTLMNRRQFVRDSAVVAAALAGASVWKPELRATPLGKPIGLAVYTVRDQIAKDFDGTLRKVAEIGYQEIEVGEFYRKTAPEFRRLLGSLGLTCPSAHYSLPALKTDWEKQVNYAHDVGIRFMGCSGDRWKSLDDVRRSAERYNLFGEQCKQAGIQFFYHNHNFEFKAYDGVEAFEELLRRTEPKLVAFEMDCFWVSRAGKDPVAYIEKYPGRFPQLHIKDLKPGFPPSTGFEGLPAFAEVGRGIIDWKRIFAAAGKAGLEHYYVEQDICERPSLESSRISYDYLKSLTL
jgi:sugar phosphate isomerase/epimerase